MSEVGFHLFVYGTLRDSGWGSRWGVGSGSGSPMPEGCRKVGEGTVRGTLYDLGDFPALMLAGGGEVPGEVWWCPARVLPELDRYEGVAESLFRRVGVRVGEVGCWVYVAGPKLGPRLLPDAVVPSGQAESTADREGEISDD